MLMFAHGNREPAMGTADRSFLSSSVGESQASFRLPFFFFLPGGESQGRLLGSLCPGGPLKGWAGSKGETSDPKSLDDPPADCCRVRAAYPPRRSASCTPRATNCSGPTGRPGNGLC